jgi:uncharacterized membrane protein
MGTGRLEAFSDGVLAIIITVMVLELHQPDGPTFGHLVHDTGTGLLTYLLSFAYIGVYWTNHHHMFQLADRVTGAILWANLGLLFCLSLLPFTTNWVDVTRLTATTPVVVYGINLLAAGVAYWILQLRIIHSQGRGSVLLRAVGRDFKGRGSMVGYVLACIAAAVGGDGPGRIGIWIAVALFVAIAGLWVIPDRRIEMVVVADLEHRPESETESETATKTSAE